MAQLLGALDFSGILCLVPSTHIAPQNLSGVRHTCVPTHKHLYICMEFLEIKNSIR